MRRIVVLALLFSLSLAAAVFTAGRVEKASKRLVPQLSRTSAGASNK